MGASGRSGLPAPPPERLPQRNPIAGVPYGLCFVPSPHVTPAKVEQTVGATNADLILLGDVRQV